jgi:tetratricopeptide (TPR) repeat protein
MAQRYPDQAVKLSAVSSEQLDAGLADYTKALALLGDKAENGVLNYALLVNRGHIRLERQDLTGAAADLQGAICLNDRRFEAFSGLGFVLERQERTDEALEQFGLAIRLQPKMAGLYRARADLLLGLTSIEPNPRDMKLRDLEQAIGKVSSDRRDQALRDLDDAIRYESPRSQWIAVDSTKQAALFHHAGRYDEAVKSCDAALEIAPRYALAHHARIHALLVLKRYDDLIRSCDVALESVKPAAELYELRGMAKDDIEDFAGAIEDYTLSLSIQPENPRVLRRRGWSYLADDANRPAAHDFDEAIRLASESADAHSGRGLARARLGQHRDAVIDATDSLRLDASTWRIAYNAAKIYALSAVAAEAESRKTGPPAVRLVARYTDRAADLVRLALERAPAEQRSVLVRETIRNDPALQPIRRRLRQLESLKFDQPEPRQSSSPPR